MVPVAPVRRAARPLLAVALLVACGGGEQETVAPAEAPLPSLDDYPGLLVAALCEPIGPCCAAEGLPHDVAGCEAQMSQVLSYWWAARDHLVLDGAKAKDCVALVRSRASACEPAMGTALAGTVCDEALRGTVPAGGPCAFEIECARPPGGVTSCLSGVCVARPRGGEGRPCGTSCRGGACDPPVVGATPDASACFADDGLRCVNGACAKLLQAGASCAEPACAVGLHCDGTCVPDATLGASCATAPCQAGAYCDDTDLCRAKAGEGTPCTSADPCLAGLVCEGSACHRPPWLSAVVCSGGK